MSKKGKKKKRKIYIGKSKYRVRKASLSGIIKNNLVTNNLNIDYGSFSDSNDSWVQVEQRSKDGKQLVVVVLGFDKDGNNFKEINVHVTPIVPEYIDEDKSKMLV